MRIFYAANDSANTVRLRDSRIWYYNLYLPLVDIGNEIIRFDYNLNPFQPCDSSNPKNKAFIDENRPKLEEELLKQIRKAHSKKPITLFFSYFHNAFCSPDVIREISRMGIVTMNWYCNASYQFHFVDKIAPAYDYCLVPERFRLEDYKRIGANPIYCQEAANPNIYKPYDLPQIHDVTFVGQKYGDRPEYIRYLLNKGVNVRVWGVRWKTKLGLKRSLLRNVKGIKRALLNQPPIKDLQQISGDPLTDEELVKMFSRSKINLGFSSCGETHKTEDGILQIRLRDFEVPMSGGFYMVGYMPELEGFFEIGKEIVCYHSKEELLDKIKFYLSHSEERERIRWAGYKRALRDHTWQKRFKDVFKGIGMR